jgi:superfamily II DNA or RNA helicase
LIKITENNYLIVEGLPDNWKKPLNELVSVKNEKKETAQKEMIRGAEYMSDRVYFIEEEENCLKIPRGFKSELLERLDKYGADYDTFDIRNSNDNLSSDYHSNIDLRPKQKEAKQAIIENEQGLVMASPGFGKTTTALDTMLHLGQKTLILIDKSELAKQWIDRAKEQFNLELGLIGDGDFKELDITVATLQTLRSRSEQLTEEGFWNKWGAIFYDESHHASSETYYDIINRFPAKFRIGLSATKGKSPSREKISEFIFGPVIFEDKSNQLIPTVHRISTSFEFDYKPTDFINGRRVQNNYQKLVNALIADEGRNQLIADRINSEPSCAHLIISRRLNHLEALKEAVEAGGFPSERTYMLTGKESADERIRIAKLADSGSIAIFSTVADEGLDIPRLDRIHLVFPSKNHETTRQQVGRGLRNHDDKTETIICDYVDIEIPVTKNQWRNRMTKYYKPNKFPIEIHDC